MKMRNHPILMITLCVMMAATIFTAILLIPSTPKQVQPTDLQQTTSYPSYVLKDYHGKIAVFHSGQNQPELVFDVYVSTLPEFDQESLQTGVFAENITELKRLIEDYTS